MLATSKMRTLNTNLFFFTLKHRKMFELSTMSPKGQVLYKAYFISVRIITGVFAYIYPSYVTLCRVLKWQSKPDKQTFLRL